MTYGAGVYNKTSKAVADPLQLVIDLYEEAARKMEEALKAIRENRYEDRFQATERVRAILLGLSDALDRSTPEQEEAANHLQNYYSMIGGFILATNVSNDQESCMAAIESLRDMAVGWKEIQANVRAGEVQVRPQDAASLQQPTLEVTA